MGWGEKERALEAEREKEEKEEEKGEEEGEEEGEEGAMEEGRSGKKRFGRFLNRFNPTHTESERRSDPVSQALVESGEASTDTETNRNELPGFGLPEDLPLIIKDEKTGATLFRATVGYSDLARPQVVPDWVKSCVLHSEKASREDMTFSFYLRPVDNKELPELPHGQ